MQLQVLLYIHQLCFWWRRWPVVRCNCFLLHLSDPVCWKTGQPFISYWYLSLFTSSQVIWSFTSCCQRPEMCMNWRNCGLSAATMSSWAAYLLRSYLRTSYMMLTWQSDKTRHIIQDVHRLYSFTIMLDSFLPIPVSKYSTLPMENKTHFVSGLVCDSSVYCPIISINGIHLFFVIHNMIFVNSLFFESDKEKNGSCKGLTKYL